MNVVAVTEQSPEQVFAYLKRCGEADAVTFVPPDGVLKPEGRYRKHVFLVGTALYSRNAVAIRDIGDKHIFYVFAHRSLIERYGLTAGRMLHELVPERAKLAPVGTYLNSLMKQAIGDSLFHKLMTYIYTLPSKTHQKPVTNAICKWIYDSSELSAVEIVDLLPVSLKPAQKHELAKILSNPVAERLKQTFADVRSGEAATVGQSVVRNRVQMFEYSYIAGNVTKVENITDTLVANRGID